MKNVALHFGVQVGAEHGVLAHLDVTPNEYVLATVHRAENTDSRSTACHCGGVVQPIEHNASGMADASQNSQCNSV